MTIFNHRSINNQSITFPSYTVEDIPN